ncbi:Oidioi.mRNA.OKI2018_I69.PAR.g10530.t1.cds [Oikopleura dioica]|uniref:Oidioi.mRNA.OKI2018_I69.PAR.g10530.t1.cds n=1 Tax=Oikopleura dioica TaxID=34765 RepID=A0ABN7RU70_OIKDI|nr:Oidioi.mRNA.OKI2018_I69.PAR.g10530.t1.cds [Oikopleura dioica]
MSEWGSKTVAELKKECKERGLKVSGTKAELVERIEEAIAEGNDTLETTGGNIEDELLAEVEEPEPEQSEETDELKTEDIIEEEPKAEEKKATPPVEDEVAKKISRAERFGLESKEVLEQKKLSRAERFGLPAAEKAKADEKKRARAERFGLTNANGTSGAAKKSKLEGTDIAVDPEKIKKRMERFGALDDPESKKKREPLDSPWPRFTLTPLVVHFISSN